VALLETLRLKPHSRLVKDPERALAAPLLSKLQRGNFVEVEAALFKAPAESRDRLLHGLGAAPEALPAAQSWAASHPQSAYAQLALGTACILSAWQIRGTGSAQAVEDKNWSSFHQRLEDSESHLTQAAALAPKLPDPYAWLLTSGIGLEAEPSVLAARFAEAITRDRWHWPAHYKYFNTLTEKWGGSHEAMFKFARETSAAAAPGSTLHVLVPAAFMEVAAMIRYEENATKARQTLRKQDVAEEVIEALHKWLRATPATLEDRLEHVSGPNRLLALNQFGGALYVSGAVNEARAVLKALAGEVLELPWVQLGSGLRERIAPSFVYDRACRELNIRVE
jgi:Domain of unknown function (DUF4034)